MSRFYDDNHYAKLNPQPIDVFRSWAEQADVPTRHVYAWQEAIYAVLRAWLKGQTVRDLRKSSKLIEDIANVVETEQFDRLIEKRDAKRKEYEKMVEVTNRIDPDGAMRKASERLAELVYAETGLIIGHDQPLPSADEANFDDGVPDEVPDGRPKVREEENRRVVAGGHEYAWRCPIHDERAATIFKREGAHWAYCDSCEMYWRSRSDLSFIRTNDDPPTFAAEVTTTGHAHEYAVPDGHRITWDGKLEDERIDYSKMGLLTRALKDSLDLTDEQVVTLQAMEENGAIDSVQFAERVERHFEEILDDVPWKIEPCAIDDPPDGWVEMHKHAERERARAESLDQEPIPEEERKTLVDDWVKERLGTTEYKQAVDHTEALDVGEEDR